MRAFLPRKIRGQKTALSFRSNRNSNYSLSNTRTKNNSKLLPLLTKTFPFSRAILELHQSNGLHDLGSIKWDMALCLFAVYVICYFSLWKGISTSGKVVWFTALFPYAVLLILLVRGVTLPGSAEGIKYYLNPNFAAITSAEVRGLGRDRFGLSFSIRDEVK